MFYSHIERVVYQSFRPSKFILESNISIVLLSHDFPAYLYIEFWKQVYQYQDTNLVSGLCIFSFAVQTKERSFVLNTWAFYFPLLSRSLSLSVADLSK